VSYGKLRPDSYVHNTLLRYSGSEHFTFQRYVLLTNFGEYVEKFKALGEHEATSAQWETVHNKALDCSMVNFGIGAPPAAMVMHCLGYLDQVDGVIMLGLAGGIADELEVGDMVGFGIAHPCSAFDRWRVIPVVDQGYDVVDVYETLF
jgi:AMP nucleosidase